MNEVDRDSGFRVSYIWIQFPMLLLLLLLCCGWDHGFEVREISMTLKNTNQYCDLNWIWVKENVIKEKRDNEKRREKSENSIKIVTLLEIVRHYYVSCASFCGVVVISAVPIRLIKVVWSLKKTKDQLRNCNFPKMYKIEWLLLIIQGSARDDRCRVRHSRL